MKRERTVQSYPPGATCSVEGCAKPVRCRGWCDSHYSRWQNHGDPLGGGTYHRPTGSEAKPCSVSDCPTPARNKGFCAKHYMGWKRHGDPTWSLPTTAERFWSRVDKESFTAEPDLGTCWIYKGGTFIRGYGMFSVGNKSVSAHRWAYKQLVGPIPDGLTLDHLCYTRNCVNPAHLAPVTNSENVIRSHGRLHYVVICQLHACVQATEESA